MFSSLTALISPHFSICVRDSGAIILQCAVIHDDKLVLFQHGLGTGCNLISRNVRPPDPPRRRGRHVSFGIMHSGRRKRSRVKLMQTQLKCICRGDDGMPYLPWIRQISFGGASISFGLALKTKSTVLNFKSIMCVCACGVCVCSTVTSKKDDKTMCLFSTIKCISL